MSERDTADGQRRTGHDDQSADNSGQGAPDSDTGGYVHRPSGEPPRQAATATEFSWRGWVLVGAIAVSFFVIPGAILLLPAAQGLVASFGLTLRAAYLTLPLVPAFLLAGLAVWSALRARTQ